MVLCDTNVLSELVRRQPNAGVLEWAKTLARVAISAVTLDEIAYGLAWKPNPRIQNWIAEWLTTSCDVLPVTSEIAWQAGALRGHLQRRGETRSQADMMIAATAQAHQLSLVTRNTAHFEGCGIDVLNPFR